MAYQAKNQRFTRFDLMDAMGVFASNPANVNSIGEDGESLYKGPIPYPKMMYEPSGAKRITVPAEIIVTPFGPKEVGEQREIVSQIVQDVAEEKRLRELGWHDHPAKAIAAGGGEAPAMSSASRIEDLERQLADATAALEMAKIGPNTAPPKPQVIPGKVPAHLLAPLET